MTTTQQRTAGARRPRRGEPRRNTPRVLVLPETMTVKELAELLDQSPVDVIKQLMRHGIMVSVNQVIDHQVATVAAAAYSVRTRLPKLPRTPRPSTPALRKTTKTCWNPVPR